MNGIRRNVLLIEKGTLLPGLWYGALFFLSACGAAISALLGTLCMVYGVKAVFSPYPFYPELAEILPQPCFPAGLFAAGALFSVYAAAFYAAFRAVYFHAADKNQRRPASFVSFRAGLRSLACGLRLFTARSALTLALRLPLLLTGGAFFLLLKTRGLSPAAFFTGTAVCAALAVLTAAAGFTLRGRYLTAYYLLYLNPLLPAREAVRAAADLGDRRLLLTARARLRLLPWRLSVLLLLPLPFALRRCGLTTAVLSEALYGEDRRRTKTPAVIFYINRDSSFRT